MSLLDPGVLLATFLLMPLLSWSRLSDDDLTTLLGILVRAARMGRDETKCRYFVGLLLVEHGGEHVDYCWVFLYA